MDDVSSETCLVLKNEFKKHRVVHQSQLYNISIYYIDILLLLKTNCLLFYDLNRVLKMSKQLKKKILCVNAPVCYNNKDNTFRIK